MNKKEYVFPMSIKKIADNEYIISSPINEINVIGTAESFGEALKVAKSSLEFTLFDMYEDNEAFPELTENEIMTIESNKTENEFITFVSTNLFQILNTFGTDPIKKMVSIPQYQDFWLKQNNISPSKLLQEVIEDRIVLS
ncbi:hypothetical protein ABE893_13170 [Enterococcus entomosocium]|uniref:hypothetical protein n=1 Tax=Enterococcus entomosocium TaxID=3034352 RepID=UPI003D6B5A8B